MSQQEIPHIIGHPTGINGTGIRQVRGDPAGTELARSRENYPGKPTFSRPTGTIHCGSLHS